MGTCVRSWRLCSKLFQVSVMLLKWCDAYKIDFWWLAFRCHLYVLSFTPKISLTSCCLLPNNQRCVWHSGTLLQFSACVNLLLPCRCLLTGVFAVISVSSNDFATDAVPRKRVQQKYLDVYLPLNWCRVVSFLQLWLQFLLELTS